MVSVVTNQEGIEVRDPKRIDRIIPMLEAYWRRNPDLRLGQIVGNFSKDRDPYYMEDEAIEMALAHLTNTNQKENEMERDMVWASEEDKLGEQDVTGLGKHDFNAPAYLTREDLFNRIDDLETLLQYALDELTVLLLVLGGEAPDETLDLLETIQRGLR